jgi:hypothetical protein
MLGAVQGLIGKRHQVRQAGCRQLRRRNADADSVLP